MPMLELGVVAPDQPNVRSVGLEIASGVIPRATGYDSLPSLQVTNQGGLNSAARGAMTGRSRGGLNFTVSGSSNRLYIGTTGDLANVSAGGGSPYTVGSDGWWDFTLFGNRVIASNYADAMESFVIGTSSEFAALSADSPRCRHLAVVRDFVVAGNIVGRGVNAATIGTAEDAVQWSAIDDPTSWPQVGTNTAKGVQSDWQPLGGNTGEVTDLVGGSDFGLIFRKRSIWRMDYEGGDTFFRFTPIEENIGCSIPKIAIRVGGIVYFPSEQGFYATDGFQTVPIGNEIIDRYFHSDFQEGTEHVASVAYFPEWKCIAWAYCGAGAATNTPNSLLLFNVVDQRWSTSSGVALEWLADVMPFTDSLDSYVDSMDSGALAAVNLDGLIAASTRTAGAFNTSHVLASFTGAAGTATLRTADYEPEVGKIAHLRSVRPVFDSAPNGMSVEPLTRMRPSDSYTSGTAAVQDETGKHCLRAAGRYLAVKFTLDGPFSGFHGFDADVRVRGVR
jgi:hypothetical protein